MRWIKLTYDTGSQLINMEQLYRVEQTSSTDLTFYDANSVLPTSYTFSSSDECTETLNKLIQILNAVDIEHLANQG